MKSLFFNRLFGLLCFLPLAAQEGGLSRPVPPNLSPPVVPSLAPDQPGERDETVHVDPPPPPVSGTTGFSEVGVPNPVRAADPKNSQEKLTETSSDFLSGLSSPIDLVGLDTSYDSTTGLVSATGNVVVKHEGMELRADRVSYHPDSGEVMAEGHVLLAKDNRVFLTDHASWNTKTGRIFTENMQSEFSPFIYSSQGVSTSQTVGSNVETEEVFLSTHDVEKPNWHMRAKRMTVTPGDKVVLHDVSLYVGGTPILWLPAYQQPLQEGAGYIPSPGYRSDWGAFFLNTYGWVYGDHTLAQYKFDVYQDRGIGLGVDLFALRYRSQKDNLPFGRLKLYYINDWDPYRDPSGIRRTETGLDPQRYRVNFQHRIYLPGPEESDLYLDFDLNKLSDKDFYRDFFSGEYQIDPQPDNQISLVKRFSATELTLWGRFQANKFFPSDTRLPEFSMDSVRQPVGKTGIYYEGQTSIGVYQQEITREDEINAHKQLAETTDPDLHDQLRALLAGEGFNRLHTYHQLSYPAQVFGWLNIVPRVGAGLTQYWDIDGYHDPGSSTRKMFHAGVDFGFKFSKIYPNAEWDALGIKEMRHIVNPYANLSYLSISDLAQGIVGIDPLIATTRPRPLDPTLHTAIEGLSDWHVVRLGVLNTLQTKRGASTMDWMSLNTYVDVFMNDPEFNRGISNLYNDLKWTPVRWLTVGVLSQLPLDSEGFYEANSYIKWMPTANVEISIGSLILQDHPFFEDSNRLTSSIYWQFADKWGIYARHAYEFQTGVLESQSYMLMHDFQTWTAGIGGQIRDSGAIGATQEYSILLMFTLKDFPRVSLPFEFNAPSSGP